MNDTATPSARLADMGFELPAVELPEPPAPPAFVMAGDRLLVSAVAPFVNPEAPIPRLNQDANVDLEDFDIEDLAEAHPLNRALLGTRSAVLRSLAIAAAAVDGDLDRIRGCVRAGLTVRTGPNFERLGLVYLPVNRIMSGLFGQGPAYSVSGVAALPAGVPMLLEAEYTLRHA
ncbi:MAG: hypothetical protein AAFY59_18530 [Pseudomonadota bacterium]